MTKTLNKIWAVLEDALRTIDSGQLSIVAWCFGPPERERAEIRKVIQVASELAPDLRAVRFPVRPLSPHLTGIRTPETALINLIGIVKVFEKIAYGDLLSSIQKDPMSNSVLLSELEQRISVSNWSGADCDRESPIPHLLARSYSAFVDRTSDAEHRPTLVSFLQHLDGRSSLKGSSDRELAERLAADPSVGVLPTQLRNLFDRHQKR